MEREGAIRRRRRFIEIADPVLLLDVMEEEEPPSPELRMFVAEQRRRLLAQSA